MLLGLSKFESVEIIKELTDRSTEGYTWCKGTWEIVFGWKPVYLLWNCLELSTGKDSLFHFLQNSFLLNRNKVWIFLQFTFNKSIFQVELDISKNKLAQFSGMTKLVWSKSLIRLNLSRNSLRSISTSISHLQNLQYLDLSHNRISTLPPASNWKCSMLMKFDLSHNKVAVSTIF